MMRRKRPRILGSLRNPVLPQASSPPSVQSNSVHFFPSQTPLPQPVTRFNPLSVFYPTSFPALKNTSYFPTLMIAMPSSSCVNKLSSKHSAYFTTPSYLSTLMTTSSTRAPLDSCLDPLSHPEASYLQPDWHILWGMSKNSLDSEPEIRESRWDLTSLVPGKSELETKTGNHEVEEAQALDNLEAFTQEAPESAAALEDSASCHWSRMDVLPNSHFGMEKAEGETEVMGPQDF
ncbi:uncharacterized protein 1700129C05Rikl isoform X5 [Rattus norvegicus]|uniref:uncharacterized protein 1700129C05Rikl isoform X5 n=1 Tax=Rattus norvegicus TaxID=10116 RepID=UPI001916EFF8|nr:uncharacterized protein LOC691850 isoform X4 [Rattus norvegicus]